MMNWKTVRPNVLQGYWIKAFTSYNERIFVQLEFCLEINEILEWLATGRTL